MGTATPAELLQAWRGYRTDDVPPLVTQDILLMAGTCDHLVPFQILADQLLTLTAARSLTTRAFTEAEHAQNHCQVGNIGLAIGGDPHLAGCHPAAAPPAPATGDAQGETHP